MSTITSTRPNVKATSRKPRPKPARSVGIIEPAAADTDGWMAVRLTVGKESKTYLVRSIECDLPGAAFAVEKLDDQLNTVETYHVRASTDPHACSCDCRGFEAHNHCKHLEGLLALGQRGKVVLRQKFHACNNCCDCVEAPGLCRRCQELDDEYSGHHQAAEMEAAGLDPWACPEADDRYGIADEPPQMEEADYFSPEDVA